MFRAVSREGSSDDLICTFKRSLGWWEWQSLWLPGGEWGWAGGPTGVDDRVVAGHTGVVAGGLLIMLGCPSSGSL